MTFLDLQNLTAYWLDDLDFGYFTKPQVKLWINNAQFEVQKLLLGAGQNYYVKPVQTTLNINQADYVLPNDFMKEHRLELVITGTPPNEVKQPLGSMTLNQQDLLNYGPAQPVGYYIKKNRLVLQPIPDLALVLRLYYSPRVAPMVLDAEVPDVPEHYHEFLAVLAAIDGLLKDGRDVKPMLDKKAYYQGMLKTDAAERTQDSSRMINVTGENSGFQIGYW
jgi:hypothetical protein